MAVVQGNIAQDDKWNPALRDRIIGRYVSMTRQAVEQGATFVIWPESSFPVYFEEDLRSHLVRRLAREAGITLLVGSDQVERVRPDATLEALDNRLLQRRVSHQAGWLDRRRLSEDASGAVRRVRAPAAAALLRRPDRRSRVELHAGRATRAAAGRRSAGEHGDLLRGRLRQPDPPLRARRERAADDDYQRCLVWMVVGRYQHWDQAAMRAIENGRYLARAANTGVSGFVDPYGRVLQKSKLFEQAVLVEDVRLLTDADALHAHRRPDRVAFARVCTVALLAAVRNSEC